MAFHSGSLSHESSRDPLVTSNKSQKGIGWLSDSETQGLQLLWPAHFCTFPLPTPNSSPLCGPTLKGPLGWLGGVRAGEGR